MLDDKARETLLSSFREESKELLSDMETVLLELEDQPDDEDLIARAFRALHTIKGNGAMFGFTAVESFTHELEKIFDQLRNHEAAVSKELIDLTLSARDQIQQMLDSEADDPPGGDTRRELLESLQELVAAGGDGVETGERREASEKPPGKREKEVIYRIRFRPPSDAFALGSYPAALLQELRRLGPCRIMALTDDIPPLSDLDPGTCFMGWDAVLSTSQGLDAVRGIFIFDQGDDNLKIEVIGEAGDIMERAGERMLGEILVERGDLSRQDMERALGEQKRFGEVLVEKRLAAPRKVESALLEQKAVRDLKASRAAADRAATIRVHSHKLDSLVDLVGELVIVQARFSQLEAEIGNTEITSLAEEVERLTWELRDSAFSIRMVPIGTTFSKFRRLVRDLSRDVGCEAEMVTEGAETELDKTVIEKLNDPLVHLIRNSIDHGIEPPELRKKAGKPAVGKIRLAASQSGADVLIEISDDGAGLDAEAIRKRAVQKGLIEKGADVPREEIYPLIFLPGFSTARKVSSVSGRGVGMDVVKSSIDAMQGSVDLRSEQGRGTTIIIRLPLTLAIIDGLEVAINRERFVMPLSYVEECVELHRKSEEKRNGRHLTNVRGDLVPYVRLREWFRIPGEPPPIEQTVITRTENRRVGLVVDHVVGEQQTVIKSLGRLYRGADGFSGATILGDGKVALLLDVPHLVRGAEMEEKAHYGGRT